MKQRRQESWEQEVWDKLMPRTFPKKQRLLYSFQENVTENEGRNHKAKQSCQKANRAMLLRTNTGGLKGTTHQNPNIVVIHKSSFFRRKI